MKIIDPKYGYGYCGKSYETWEDAFYGEHVLSDKSHIRGINHKVMCAIAKNLGRSEENWSSLFRGMKGYFGDSYKESLAYEIGFMDVNESGDIGDMDTREYRDACVLFWYYIQELGIEDVFPYTAEEIESYKSKKLEEANEKQRLEQEARDNRESAIEKLKSAIGWSDGEFKEIINWLVEPRYFTGHNELLDSYHAMGGR